ncbi:MAG: asparagine synthase (glutamine-hydrolyzing) [Phycisphaerales bacterium]|nr:asparagine synthase (glutamine-hydrolyzing) [Phycisphaerales bacterium]
MCGIAGLVTTLSSSFLRPDAEVALRRMNRCMTHRGPDDEGSESFSTASGAAFVGLGQRRLSIIDLSPAGHQPMRHPETGDTLTFNGELYNYLHIRERLARLGVSFRGHSDTEVLLHALVRWGPEVLAEFAGMYALALWSPSKNTLLLARDPVGIKPLYVAEIGGRADGPNGIVFGSEARALLASGLVRDGIDRAAVATLLAFGAVSEPRSFFEGIRSFPSGCHQTFTLDPASGRLSAGPPVRHWDFPAPDPSIDERAAIDRLRTTFDTAVKEHLIADVPVGVFLSSGLDSTIVAALAARHTPRLRTFTVGFADQPDMSESDPARRTAEALGVEHTDLQITGPDALASTADWLNALDQPSMDGLNTFVISKAVRGQGIIVALSGLGGDELFAGYPSFQDVPRLMGLVRWLSWLPAPLRAAALTLPALRSNRAVRDKLSDIARSEGSSLAVYLHRRRVLADRQLAALGVGARDLALDETFAPPEAFAEAKRQAGGDTSDAVAAISRFECQFYMRNVLLRDSDANGMAHSLEIRVPVLDTRLLDLAHRIPGRVRSPDGLARKHLLRAAFPEALRPELTSAVKKGFALPIRRWMVGPLRDLCESSLARLKSEALLDPRGVDAVWSQFLGAPETPIWSRAFTLVVLGSYLERARRFAPAPAPAAHAAV